MKKVFFAVLVASLSIVGVSLSTPSAAQNDYVIGFNVPKALYLTDCKATIEYSIPCIISGTIDLKDFEKIYRLIPSNITSKCQAAFYEISSRPEREFTYGGVKIKHTDTTWEFYYGGASLIVRNATHKDLYYIFGESDSNL